MIMDLMPELYPIIASHLPLYITPSTLLALALVNHHIFAIVLPILYSRLILKTDKHALVMIRRLLAEPELGKHVRELHTLFALSLATTQGQTPSNTLTGIHQVITKGLLPHIHTLHLCQTVDVILLAEPEETDSEITTVVRPVKLPSDFWSALNTNCPRLRGLILGNFSEYAEPSSRMEAYDLLKLQAITSLNLNFVLQIISKKEVDKILKSIEHLSPGLHTLHLEPADVEGWTPSSSFFALHFPRLRSLSLNGFADPDPSQAMEFWKRHPKLEFLKIIHLGNSCISKDLVFENLFPNLRHLQACFDDVRALAPILNQMISLTIFQSTNAQVSYLLRSVLPDGLPNLKSLNISLSICDDEHDEGGRWYESVDFCPASDSEEEALQGCIHSIARDAPNLEELCVHGGPIRLQRYPKFASDFSRFRNLRRFYFQGPSVAEKGCISMITSTKALAEACGQLAMVVDITQELPYVVARISRGENGQVASVDLGEIYYGMQIGREDEAFPQSF